MAGNIEFTVRGACINDVDGMAIVACRAWQFAYQGILDQSFIDSVADPISFAERIRGAMSKEAHRLVAVSPDSTILGFANERRPCSLEGFDAEIAALYVDPTSSRSGVGRSLVREMASRFQSDGKRSLAIHTLEQNRIGSAFYEKIGCQLGPISTWQGVASKWYIWPDMSTFR